MFWGIKVATNKKLKEWCSIIVVPVFVSHRAGKVINAAQHREFSANKKFTKALGEVCRNMMEFALMPQLKVTLIC